MKNKDSAIKIMIDVRDCNKGLDSVLKRLNRIEKQLKNINALAKVSGKSLSQSLARQATRQSRMA